MSPTDWSTLFLHITEPPKTVSDAVDRLMDILGAEHKLAIAAMPEKDLIDLHFSLGLEIRNAFGLHNPESKLMKSSGSVHPDDVSEQIIHRLWKQLRSL